jgi:hypothetical protein
LDIDHIGRFAGLTPGYGFDVDAGCRAAVVGLALAPFAHRESTNRIASAVPLAVFHSIEWRSGNLARF